MPIFVETLIKEGKLGRKSGEGLYKRVEGTDGKKETWVWDLENNEYRPKKQYDFEFVKRMIDFLKEGNYEEAMAYLVADKSLEAEICLAFLIRYVIYGINLVKEIGGTIQDVDHVMVMGFNWVPILGVIEVLGGKERVKELAYQRLPKWIIEKIDLEELLNIEIKPSYDYRRYFKAKL